MISYIDYIKALEGLLVKSCFEACKALAATLFSKISWLDFFIVDCPGYTCMDHYALAVQILDFSSNEMTT